MKKLIGIVIISTLLFAGIFTGFYYGNDNFKNWIDGSANIGGSIVVPPQEDFDSVIKNFQQQINQLRNDFSRVENKLADELEKNLKLTLDIKQLNEDLIEVNSQLTTKTQELAAKTQALNNALAESEQDQVLITNLILEKGILEDNIATFQSVKNDLQETIYYLEQDSVQLNNYIAFLENEINYLDQQVYELNNEIYELLEKGGFSSLFSSFSFEPFDSQLIVGAGDVLILNGSYNSFNVDYDYLLNIIDNDFKVILKSPSFFFHYDIFERLFDAFLDNTFVDFDLFSDNSSFVSFNGDFELDISFFLRSYSSGTYTGYIDFTKENLDRLIQAGYQKLNISFYSFSLIDGKISAHSVIEVTT